MPSSFPGALDNIPADKVNGMTMLSDHPGHHNLLADAVNALERGLVGVVSPTQFGAVGDGVTDDGPAFNQALAALCAVGGGMVQVPAGTFKITTQVVVPCDGIEIRGAGVRATVLTDGAILSGMIYASGRSRLALRDLTLRPQAAYGSYGFYVEGGASEVTDVLIENVRVDQLNATASGCVLTGAAGGLRRVTLRNVVVTSPAGGTGPFGLGLGAGNTGVTSHEVLLDGCTFDGFDAALRQTTPGVWNQIKVSSCIFRNAVKHGGYFYHCGRTQFVNSEFTGNDVGLFLTDGAGNQGSLITGCRFLSNTTMGMWSEELGFGAITGCAFHQNGYGLWVTSGLEWSISGSTFVGNHRDGVLVDRHATITSIANGAVTYSPVVVSGIQTVLFSGCVVASNDRNGMSIRGVQKAFRVTGCHVVNNGQADNPNPPVNGPGPTNYADLSLGADADATNNWSVEISGTTIGNVGGTGTYTGYTRWGLTSAGGTLSYLDVVGCRFETLTIPMSVPTAVSCVVAGSTFVGCANNITLPTGRAWRANQITGGTLVPPAESLAAAIQTALRPGALLSANNLALPVTHNVFIVQGGVQINLLDPTGWQTGSILTIIFYAATTVKHMSGAVSGFRPLRLNGAVDFAAAINSTLTLVWEGNEWFEVARKA